MFWSRQYDAFISYSHKDQAVVEPLVELLSLNERRVFWDHNLKAGDRWDKVLQTSVKESDIFVLFWCCDSRESKYIAKEIDLALRLKKKIVPVKLCPAAMPEPLGGWQWIDLQKRVQHDCGTLDHGAPGKPFAIARDVPCQPSAIAVPAPRKTAFTPVMLAVAAGSMVLLLVLVLDLRSWKGHVPPPPVAGRTHEAQIGRDAAPPQPLPSPVPDQDSDQLARLEKQAQQAARNGQERSPASKPPSVPIPAGAIRAANGYIVLPDPKVNRSGYILEIGPRGTLGYLFPIPIELPSPKRLDFHEVTRPWWYANLQLLFVTAIILAAVGALAGIIVSRRKRVRHTLGITMEYLHRLAND